MSRHGPVTYHGVPKTIGKRRVIRHRRKHWKAATSTRQKNALKDFGMVPDLNKPKKD